MTNAFHALREFKKRCQKSSSSMLLLFHITKTFQTIFFFFFFLTVPHNNANLLALHYGWDSKNLLTVSWWLSNGQQTWPSPRWANGSPMQWHQQNVPIESVKVTEHCGMVCQATRKNAVKESMKSTPHTQQSSARQLSREVVQKAAAQLQRTG